MRTRRQTNILFLLCVSLCAFAPLRSLAADSAASEADLAPLERATVQHASTLKTFDTFSRQILSAITGRGTLDGQPPTHTLLSMGYEPREWVSRPIIKIRHLPLREDVAAAFGLEGEEERKFLKQATISLEQYHDPRVEEMLEHLESKDLRKLDAVRELRNGAASLEAMLAGSGLMPPALMVPPADGQRTGKWHAIDELVGNSPVFVRSIEQAGMTAPEPIEGYDGEAADAIIQAAAELRLAWLEEDGEKISTSAAALAAALEEVNPQAYPSLTKRKAEVLYNRLAKLTLPGAALYFVAMTLFLVAAYSVTPRLRLWGLRFMILGLLVHTAGIAVRWWLVEKSTDDWFHSIPIKNQFESVMFSAWFGALVGLILELRRKKAGGGLFGAAASFVGWLSLLALFAAPYVFGRDIGGEIGQAAGILMSYWLYIHVTMVTASYALIGMSFLLACWWLIAFLTGKGAAIPDAATEVAGSGRPQGFFRTLGQVFFLPVRSDATSANAFEPSPVDRPQTLLQRLDAANLVILQLAFWVLGAGVVFGAIWADMSWGRPWGWDPKETFALVTWMVYLVVIHVRLVTKHKALWTSILAIVGFFVMLFNWIGVNFFLVGLHSYA